MIILFDVPEVEAGIEESKAYTDAFTELRQVLTLPASAGIAAPLGVVSEYRSFGSLPGADQPINHPRPPFNDESVRSCLRRILHREPTDDEMEHQRKMWFRNFAG